MKLVIQRVTNAQVDVEGKTVGKIENGFKAHWALVLGFRIWFLSPLKYLGKCDILGLDELARFRSN